jgi:hypothetical protein
MYSGYMATLLPLPCGIALELFSIPTENIYGGSELLLLKTRVNLGEILRELASGSVQDQREL